MCALQSSRCEKALEIVFLKVTIFFKNSDLFQFYLEWKCGMGLLKLRAQQHA